MLATLASNTRKMQLAIYGTTTRVTVETMNQMNFFAPTAKTLLFPAVSLAFGTLIEIRISKIAKTTSAFLIILLLGVVGCEYHSGTTRHVYGLTLIDGSRLAVLYREMDFKELRSTLPHSNDSEGWYSHYQFELWEWDLNTSPTRIPRQGYKLNLKDLAEGDRLILTADSHLLMWNEKKFKSYKLSNDGSITPIAELELTPIEQPGAERNFSRCRLTDEPIFNRSSSAFMLSMNQATVYDSESLKPRFTIEGTPAYKNFLGQACRYNWVRGNASKILTDDMRYLAFLPTRNSEITAGSTILVYDIKQDKILHQQNIDYGSTSRLGDVENISGELSFYIDRYRYSYGGERLHENPHAIIHNVSVDRLDPVKPRIMDYKTTRVWDYRRQRLIAVDLKAYQRFESEFTRAPPIPVGIYDHQTDTFEEKLLDPNGT